LLWTFVIDREDDAGGPSPQTSRPTPPAKSTSFGYSLPYVKDPPSDIEGRCSPSNLPGSLSACMAACLPSMCCYPDRANNNKNVGKPSCLDRKDERSVEACRRYMPFCDVFYDTWAGGAEGDLRMPSPGIVQMCAEENEKKLLDFVEEDFSWEDNDVGNLTENVTTFESFDGEEDNEVGNLTENDMTVESFERKRLRGHNPTFHNEHRRRRLDIVDSPSEICQQHCMAARCCHAPLNDPRLVMSSSGVYTHFAGGKYAVTNCQEDSIRNQKACVEYDAFCDYAALGDADGMTFGNGLWTGRPSPAPEAAPEVEMGPSLPPTASADMVPTFEPTENVFTIRWTSRPTAVPTVSASPSRSVSPTRTSRPSSRVDSDRPSAIPTLSWKPTTSSPPTVTPSINPKIAPAETLEIAASCSGSENVQMIAAGLSPGRMECIKSCQNGLCCYANELGYGSWMSQCYVGNEGRCLEYYPCLVLVSGKEMIAPTALVAAAENAPSTATPAAAADAPPAAVVTDNTLNGDASTTDATTNEAPPLKSSGDSLPPPAQEAPVPTNNGGTDINIIEAPPAPITSPGEMLQEDPAQDPPFPDEDLAVLCSQNSTSALEGFQACERACRPGSCCYTQGTSPCQDAAGAMEICALYEPCIKIAILYQGGGTMAAEGGGAQLQPPASPVEDAVPTEDNKPVEDDTPQVDLAVVAQGGPDPDTATPQAPELPPEASTNLPAVCSYESLSSNPTAAGLECFQLCRLGECCTDGNSCWENADAPDGLLNVCATYTPCNNLNLLRTPPSDIDQVCNGDDSAADECAAICSAVSCCFLGSSSYYDKNDVTDSTSNIPLSSSQSSPSCYVHFEETCLGYAPYCVPQQPSVATVPPPQNDLNALCAFSVDFCKEVCKDASCCFESSAELSCLADNEERCKEFSTCAKVYP